MVRRAAAGPTRRATHQQSLGQVSPRRALWRTLWLLAALGGCGSDPAPTDLPDGGTDAGDSGGAMPCPPGERPLDDGSCEPAGATAGTPPERCAEGFVADDAGGCTAIIVEQPCAPGQIAQLGESSCHDIAPCGSGSWGDIPDDPDHEYVDPSFSGASDGSTLAPWTTIADAMQAAAPGAVVALAAGTYGEDVRLDGKAVRLRGRCPSMVTIEGAGIQPAAVSIVATDGVEVRGLAVTGPRMGIWVRDSDAVRVDEAWIHDVEELGLAVRGPASQLSAHTVLVEAARGSGVLAEGATVDLEQSTVRSTRSDDHDVAGYGALVQMDRDTGDAGRLTVRSSVLERSRGAGLATMGADLEVVGALVRDTLPDLAGAGGGFGVAADLDPNTSARPSVRLESSEIRNSVGYGVLVHGGDATIEATSIRDVAPHPTELDLAWGVALLEHAVAAQSPSATIRQSLVERAQGAGIYAMGGAVNIEETIVRDTQLLTDSNHGRGIELDASPLGLGVTQATVRSSLIAANHEVGLLAAGVDLTLEATAIVDTLPNVGEEAGYGLLVEQDPLTFAPAHAEVRWCSIESNIAAGLILAGAEGTIESTVVARTESRPSGTAGVGLTAQISHDTLSGSVATVRHCHIEGNHEMGVFIDGSRATIEATDVAAAAPDGLGWYGDCIGVRALPGYREVTQIRDSTIGHCHRAGILSVGAAVELTGVTLDCNPIHLNGEPAHNFDSAITDLGGNRCGCGPVVEECRVLSVGLDAPDPVY